MTIWFTSDPHFGHKFVAGLRGFDDYGPHDDAIRANWKKVVADDDIVWVLGDLCMASPDYALSVMYNLPGHKHLIWGNHDAGHPMHKGAQKIFRRYLNVFDTVQPFAKQKWDGIEFMLSHFPYTRDHGFEIRYPQWRLPDLGGNLIHGHTHGKEQFTGREIHVGLDAWDLTPVNLNTILKGFKEENGID